MEKRRLVPLSFRNAVCCPHHDIWEMPPATNGQACDHRDRESRALLIQGLRADAQIRLSHPMSIDNMPIGYCYRSGVLPLRICGKRAINLKRQGNMSGCRPKMRECPSELSAIDKAFFLMLSCTLGHTRGRHRITLSRKLWSNNGTGRIMWTTY